MLQVRNTEEDRQKLLAKRDNLYWDYRYRKGSYKSRKMGLQPILMMAKYGDNKERVYGEAGETIESPKIRFATERFKAWKQKERELQRLAKEKEDRQASLAIAH